MPLKRDARLLKSPQCNHRAARHLLREIACVLVEQAAAAYARGDLLAAGENINCAEQCVELPAEAACATTENLRRAREFLLRRQEWQSQRLAQARTWANQGRVRSAIGLLVPLPGDGEVQRLKCDLEERVGAARTLRSRSPRPAGRW